MQSGCSVNRGEERRKETCLDLERGRKVGFALEETGDVTRPSSTAQAHTSTKASIGPKLLKVRSLDRDKIGRRISIIGETRFLGFPWRWEWPRH